MRLGARVPTTIDEGEFAGVEATVDQIIGGAVLTIAAALASKFLAAEGAADLAPLVELCEFYEREARPVWNIEDGRGPVPPTQAGMLRLPVPLVLNLYDLWCGTFPQAEEPEATAVDAVIPPGPLRDELNAGLLAAKE